MQGILDPALELAKLEKKAAEARGRADAVRKRMALPGYMERTPQAVRDEDAEKLARAETEVTAAEQHMQDMQRLMQEEETGNAPPA